MEAHIAGARFRADQEHFSHAAEESLKVERRNCQATTKQARWIEDPPNTQSRNAKAMSRTTNQSTQSGACLKRIQNAPYLSARIVAVSSLQSCQKHGGQEHAEDTDPADCRSKSGQLRKQHDEQPNRAWSDPNRTRPDGAAPCSTRGRWQLHPSELRHKCGLPRSSVVGAQSEPHRRRGSPSRRAAARGPGRCLAQPSPSLAQ